MKRYLLLAACHAGAWNASIGGTRGEDASAHGVAVASTGSAVLLWSAHEELALSRYDASGRLAWTRAVSAPECPGLSSGAVAFAPDGDVVVAADGRERVCVIDYKGDGTFVWTHAMPGGGPPSLAIDTGGQIVVTAGRQFIGGRAITALSASGAVAWSHELELPDHRVAVPGKLAIAGDTIGVLAHVVGADGALVDLDPSSPGIDAVALFTLATDGHVLATTPIPTPDAGTSALELSLASDGAAFFAGWTTNRTGHVAKIGAWTRELPGAIVFGLAARADAILVLERRRDYAIEQLAPDGTPRGTVPDLSGDRSGEPPIPGLGIEHIALADHALALAGFAEKRVHLGAAGAITTECWTESRTEPDDTPRHRDEEVCAEAAFVARLAL